jgi:hypothetical protein
VPGMIDREIIGNGGKGKRERDEGKSLIGLDGEVLVVN